MLNDISQQVVEKLTELGQTLAVAESCTGGRLSAAITAVPGSSKVFLGGVVSYSDDVKEALLDVSAETLRIHGAVSPETAREMARGVQARLKADYGIGITGIAGPDGGTPTAPVGMVYVAWAGPEEFSNVARMRFPGDREQVQQSSVELALAGLMQRIGLIEL
ncbi:MAG: CinA family protein [bacterium]|nr:CinA family protein [bacterium]